jgi:oxygen-independent coproporphyrinogen-3 oxidase
LSKFDYVPHDTESNMTEPARPLISAELIEKFDISGPRYTSYPTADRFGADFGEQDYRNALGARAAGTPGAKTPLSLYVHLPFCQSLCYFCGCNKIITKHKERAAPYLETLYREIDMHAEILGAPQGASQLHFGGGTPTFLSDAELSELMARLEKAFGFHAESEMSIEVDPRTITPERLGFLRSLGFNRISFGVQDFDPAVQKSVNRIQPVEQVRDLVDSARDFRFDSVNLDLIYGLPLQTPESFDRTLAQVASLRPDRIALYAYAHLPERFKSQRMIPSAEIPPAAAKIQMLARSLAAFDADGYDYIGMDHFALPDDSLAIAKKQGKLHRNFQGYSTQPDCDLVALGVSSIGRVGSTYSQNAKTLDEYTALIAQGKLPISKGLALNADDILRRDVIMSTMCQGRVDFAEISSRHGIDFQNYFATELAELRAMHGQGLATVEPGSVEVTSMGWYFVRAVAMAFDGRLRAGSTGAKYSKIL